MKRWLLALLLLLCSCKREQECVDATGCSAPTEQVVAPGQCKEGYEPHVCADDGSWDDAIPTVYDGRACYKLDNFGTDVGCSGVTVMCCEK